MAQIVKTVIHDGPRNAVLHVSFVGDGGGDLTDEVLLDPAAFDPPLPSRPALRICQLWYDFTGFDAYLEYDYLFSDTPIWTLSGGQGTEICFEKFGGLTDRSNPLDGSGKLMVTTSGLEVGDFGTLVLGVEKS